VCGRRSHMPKSRQLLRVCGIVWIHHRRSVLCKLLDAAVPDTLLLLLLLWCLARCCVLPRSGTSRLRPSAKSSRLVSRWRRCTSRARRRRRQQRQQQQWAMAQQQRGRGLMMPRLQMMKMQVGASQGRLLWCGVGMQVTAVWGAAAAFHVNSCSSQIDAAVVLTQQCCAECAAWQLHTCGTGVVISRRHCMGSPSGAGTRVTTAGARK
jgi:hypothetical protein